MTVLTSQRVSLRPVHEHDRSAVVALHTSEKVRAYLGGPLTQHEARARFEHHIKTMPEHHWAVVELQTDQCIGLIMLHPHHDGEGLEVSYLLSPQFWGQGYACEALSLVTDYAQQLKLPHLFAETQIANVASCRLLERVGMQRIKRLERFGAQQALYLLTFESY